MVFEDVGGNPLIRFGAEVCLVVHGPPPALRGRIFKHYAFCQDGAFFLLRLVLDIDVIVQALIPGFLLHHEWRTSLHDSPSVVALAVSCHRLARPLVHLLKLLVARPQVLQSDVFIINFIVNLRRVV